MLRINQCVKTLKWKVNHKPHLPKTIRSIQNQVSMREWVKKMMETHYKDAPGRNHMLQEQENWDNTFFNRANNQHTEPGDTMEGGETPTSIEGDKKRDLPT